jgi:uncharacterized protein (TIGR02145 family)
MKTFLLLIGSLSLFFGIRAQTVTDIDGNIYNSITIGTQVWMRENLKVTHYMNGEEIPRVTDATEWSKLTTGAYCNLNNEDLKVTTYGRLYNFYAVLDSNNLCPADWHVPTNNEWMILIGFLGGTDVAGGKMKETGTEHWSSPNTGASNSSGFTAVSAGSRNSKGGFEYFGSYGDWWTSTESDTSNGSHWGISNSSSNIYNVSFNKKYGFSVRCIRDFTTKIDTSTERFDRRNN